MLTIMLEPALTDDTFRYFLSAAKRALDPYGFDVKRSTDHRGEPVYALVRLARITITFDR